MMPIQDAAPPPTVVEAVEIRPARLPPAASEAAFSVIRLDEDDLEGRQRLDQAISQAPGASLFRRRVMKSGPQGARRRWNLWRSAPLPVAKTGRNTI